MKQVSYEIMNGTGLNKFYMNHSFPGWVYTKVKLDYEEASQYNLRVLAYDHGHPRKEHSVDYEIYVTDENEYTPRFDKPSFSFDILASLEVGSVIGNVSVVVYKFISFLNAVQNISLTECQIFYTSSKRKVLIKMFSFFV